MDIPKPVSTTSPRFMDQFRVFIRSRGLAYKTEKTYCSWVKRFIHYKGYSAAADMRPEHIDTFLTHLAVDKTVSVNTQRTALNALVFLFREFLRLEIGELTFNQARKPPKLPTILSKDEALSVIANLNGLHRLIVQLLYGGGLRVMEAARLRIKDVDIGSGGPWVQ